MAEAEAEGAEPASELTAPAAKATEAKPTAVARARRVRRRTALVVCVGGVARGVLRLERGDTGVLVNAEGIVGDLSSVGQGPSDDGGALTLFWLGGPHVCAFNAPAGHREGCAGLATRAGCASGCSCPVSGWCGYVQRSSAVWFGGPTVAEGCVRPDQWSAALGTLPVVGSH